MRRQVGTDVDHLLIKWFIFSQEATGRVFGSAYDIWEDLYELIIKDYISDVYSDVIETFLGASIKV